MYFCPSNWHKQDFTYFGLYREKSVRTIATVENCIVADFDKAQNNLTVHYSTMDKEITEAQKERLREGLIDWGDSHSGLKYYLFNEQDFYETDFRKCSKGGIQGVRYRDLKDFVEKDQLKGKSTKEISNLLKHEVWY